MPSIRSTLALATLSLALATTFSVPAAQAQQAAAATSPDPWWKHAVFYEIYPRSYQDSNGDGTGDINGITSRLDHLKELGVNAIWIAPCYPSPQVDFGYDISDYENIDPQYGTLADFDHLLAEARKRDIRIIMDMVLNHTSDQHAWFIDSASSKDNPKRDWYVWRDGKVGPDGKLGPPNNWLSQFGHSAWQLDPKTNQYYYHRFYIQQPDLNWRNPAVEKAMFDSMRFWLDRGVAGFRLDAIDTLLEDPSFGDEENVLDKDGKIEIDAFGEKRVDSKKTDNLPEIHDIIKRMRTMIASYPGDRVLIGETYLPNVQELDKWYGGSAQDELQLPMDMQVGMINKLDAPLFRTRLVEADTMVHGGRPLFVIDNHDNPRMDRYCTEKAGAAPGADCIQIQKMLSTLLFTTRAAALMYYGDEIGMSTTEPTRKEDVKDPVGVTAWPKFKGRDGERTPMQWTPGKDAGFSTADHTWLPIPPSYLTVNVQTETPIKSSDLTYYKSLIGLRRDNSTLRDGGFEVLTTSAEAGVLAYLRTAPNDSTDKKMKRDNVLVLLNFTGTPQTITFEDKSAARVGATAHTLTSNYDAGKKLELKSITLPPYGAYVGEVK
jgi:alpha-glucosidase